MKVDWLIVGAGLTGATLAERLAARGKRVLVIDRRPHIAGNAHDAYDEHHHLIHPYGPHIFHTQSELMWNYLSRFTTWRSYEHRVRAEVDGKLVPVPFNLDTLHALVEPTRAKRLERSLLESYGEGAHVPVLQLRKTADADLRWLGDFAFESLFHGYTSKMWGVPPEELDASVTGRVPLRVSRDDRYVQDRFQGIPVQGYTHLVQNMLRHPNIHILLGAEFSDVERDVDAHGVVYTGGLDALFGHTLGALPYRTLDFDRHVFAEAQRQPTASINYPGPRGATRSNEYKHLTGQRSPSTTVIWEYPRAHVPGETEPFYPVPMAANHALHRAYLELAARERPEMVLAGRLADYRDYNMDQAVARALALMTKDPRLSA